MGDTNSTDTVWFIQIVESNCVEDGTLCDYYDHKIAAGVNSLKKHFLEKEKELSKTKVFLSIAQRRHTFTWKVFFIFMSTSLKARRVSF